MCNLSATTLTYKFGPDCRWLRIYCLVLMGFLVSPVLRAQTTRCSVITNTSLLSVTVCTEARVDSLPVTTTAGASDKLEFVRFDSSQTNPYDGGVVIGDVFPENGKATLRNVHFPPHWSTTDRIYYVYARLKIQPTDPHCRPAALIRVFIRANPTASVVAREATCYSAESQQDGAVLITGYNPTDSYELAVNGVFTGQRNGIPADSTIVDKISRTGTPKTYTVRITDSLGCYTDRSITMMNARCDCPPMRCVPIVITKKRSGR